MNPRVLCLVTLLAAASAVNVRAQDRPPRPEGQGGGSDSGFFEDEGPSSSGGEQGQGGDRDRPSGRREGGGMMGGPGGMRGEPLTDEQIAEVKAFFAEFDPSRLEEPPRGNGRGRNGGAGEGGGGPGQGGRGSMGAGGGGDNGPKPDSQMRYRELYREMQHLKEVKERDPDEFTRMSTERKAESQCRKLAEALRKLPAKDPGREAQTSQLREAMSKLFDLREAGKTAQIKRLEEELQRLRGLVEKRQASKQTIIEKKMKEMAGEEDEMGW